MKNSIETSFLFLNRILPEEDPTGYVVAQSRNRGLSTYSRVAEQMSRSGTTKAAWVHPSGLRAMATLFKCSVPSFETLLEENTRFYLASAFLNETDTARLYGHYADEAINGPAILVGMNSGHFRGRLGVCPECMKHDIVEYGYTVWKRLYLMPGIETCPIHQRVLMTFCEACETGRRHSGTSPRFRCNCGGSLRPVNLLNTVEEGFSIQVSSMAHALMRRDVTIGITPDTIPTTLRAKFTRAGLEGYAPEHALGDAIEDVVGTGFMQRVGMSPRVLKRFFGLSPEQGPVRHPILNVITIAAVFGDWNSFAGAARHAESASTYATPVEAQPLPQRPKRIRLTQSERLEYLTNLSESEFNEIRDRSRSWLLTAVAANPDINRKELWVLPGADAPSRFFRCGADTDFYEQAIPRCAKGQGPVGRLQSEASKVALVNHIKARYASLIATSPEKKIGKPTLLANFRGTSNETLLRMEPAVQVALNEYADTKDTWRKRVTALFCERVRRISKTSTFGNKDAYDRLDHEDFVCRLAGARAWLKANRS